MGSYSPDAQRQSGLMSSIEALSEEDLRSTLPWTSFLLTFHQKTGREAFQQLQAIIGDEVLWRVFPIRRNSLLEVKSGTRRCLSLLITETSFSPDLYTCFPGLPPAQWHCFPDNAELSFRLKSPHPNFEGQIWNYRKRAGDPVAIMTSDKGETLDFDIWLQDALDPSTKGTVEARYPTEFVPSNLQLPGVSDVSVEDSIMPSLSISRYDRSQPWRQNTGLTIGDRVSSQMREKMELLHPGSKETKEKAFRLIEGWRRWSSVPGLNPLLYRIVHNYLNDNSAKSLSGIVALIVRLKAHSYEFGNAARPDQGLDSLLKDSLEFVRIFLPRAFLRDLILHEIITTWYWHKSLDVYEKPRA